MSLQLRQETHLQLQPEEVAERNPGNGNERSGQTGPSRIRSRNHSGKKGRVGFLL